MVTTAKADNVAVKRMDDLNIGLLPMEVLESKVPEDDVKPTNPLAISQHRRSERANRTPHCVNDDWQLYTGTRKVPLYRFGVTDFDEAAPA